MSVVWKVKKWEELNKQELYEILRLRSEIFIVEQECPYQDIDNKDIFSQHYFGKIKNEIWRGSTSASTEKGNHLNRDHQPDFQPGWKLFFRKNAAVEWKKHPTDLAGIPDHGNLHQCQSSASTNR